jgi:fluoride ion exporter CrcB/FEX
MGISLKGMNQIDDVRVRAKMTVTKELFRPFIYGKLEANVVGSCLFGHAFDSNNFVCLQIQGSEDHSK